jgi:hypothetical protein
LLLFFRAKFRNGSTATASSQELRTKSSVNRFPPAEKNQKFNGGTLRGSRRPPSLAYKRVAHQQSETKPEKGEAKENFQRNRVKKELTLPRSRRRTRINQESAGFVRGLWTNGKGNGNGDRKVKGWAKKRRRKATGRGRRARRNGRWECQGLRVWELLVPQSVTRCCPAGARYHRHHGRRSREA